MKDKDYSKMSKDELFNEIESVSSKISETQEQLDSLRETFDALHYYSKEFFREEFKKYEHQFIYIEVDDYILGGYVSECEFADWSTCSLHGYGFTNYYGSFGLVNDIDNYITDDVIDYIQIITEEEFLKIFEEILLEKKNEFLSNLKNWKDKGAEKLWTAVGEC